MNLNKKNNLKNIEYNNKDNIKEEEYSYIIDSKNILKIEKTKKLNEDLGKYFGFQIDVNEEELVNQSTSSSMTSSVGNTIVEWNNIQKLIHIFTEKLFPKCNLDSFVISKKLAIKYSRTINENKNKLEECINYIYNNRQKLTYYGYINLDLNIIHNLGYILLASYKKFNDFKIYNIKSLKSNISKTTKDLQNVLQDFFNYCNERKYIPEHNKKVSYWDKHCHNYYLPGIFIFLINSLDKIETININFDIINDSITNEDVDYLSIILYNIQNIFTNINHAKINLINPKLQCYMYSNYYEEYQKALNENNKHIKKRYLNLDYIYDKKWDFKTEFLLDQYRQIYKKEMIEQKKKDNNIDNMNKAKTYNINKCEVKNEEKKLVKSTSSSRLTEFLRDIKSNLHHRFSVQPTEDLPKLIKKNYFSSEMEEEMEDTNEELLNNNPDKIYKKKDENYYSNILKCILLSISSLNSLNNICKLDLIINDSYYPEFCNFFENEIFDQENKSANIPLLKDFHLIDIIANKFTKLNILNLEINSLDSITFKKILELIYSNSFKLSLNISFFSSDATYLQQSLFKLYNPSQEREDYKEITEFKILNKLLNDFSNNMQMLFNLIKYKKILTFGFNFDIPDIIENNQKFIMVIIKFILNLLLFISKKDATIQKAIILAPKIKLNNDFATFFDKILGNINNDDNNKILKELSLQIQLYKIINIKNVISESLIILNIGNCDNLTFQELVKYLTSCKFCIRSSLSRLSISLIRSIRILNKEIYNLLFTIFNIKIKQLKQLNIYSNIIINHIKEYIYLLNIFNNNWISSCNLTLNSKSEEIYKLPDCQNEKNKIKYLVPASLEIELLSPDDMILKKKINNDIKTDNIFWYLRYIFKVRHSCVDNYKKKRKESLSKFLANNILSYMHFQKFISIKHNLNEEDFKE